MDEKSLENFKKDECRVPEEFKNAKSFIDEFNYEEIKGYVERDNRDPNTQRVQLKFIEIVKLYKEGKLKISDTEIWDMFNEVNRYIWGQQRREARLEETSRKSEGAVDFGWKFRNIQNAYKNFLTEEELAEGRKGELMTKGLLKSRMIGKIRNRFQQKSEEACKKIEEELDKILNQNNK